jgi:hypothetical protein
MTVIHVKYNLSTNTPPLLERSIFVREILIVLGGLDLPAESKGAIVRHRPALVALGRRRILMLMAELVKLEFHC